MTTARSSYSDSADVECLAAHFVVCGLAPGNLEPNTLSLGRSCPRVNASLEVITDIAIVAPGRGECIPPGYVPVLTAGGGARSAPPIGSVAAIGGLGALQLQVAVRRQALDSCSGAGSGAMPITALRVVYADRGETPGPGYEALRRTEHGERASFVGGSRGREAVLCVSRELGDECAVPLLDLVVVYRDRHTRDVNVPAEYELLPRCLTAGSVGAAVFFAFRRAPPFGLLNTPLRPTLLDHVAASHRPKPASRESRRAAGGSGEGQSSRTGTSSAGAEEEGLGCWGGKGEARGDELPHALPHFCLPRGVLLRDGGAWPTAHEFALTNASGRRMYGVCLTVWEPLLGDVLLYPQEAEEKAEEEGEEDAEHAEEVEEETDDGEEVEETSGTGRWSFREGSAEYVERPMLPVRTSLALVTTGGSTRVRLSLATSTGASPLPRPPRLLIPDSAIRAIRRIHSPNGAGRNDTRSVGDDDTPTSPGHPLPQSDSRSGNHAAAAGGWGGGRYGGGGVGGGGGDGGGGGEGGGEGGGGDGGAAAAAARAPDANKEDADSALLCAFSAGRAVRWEPPQEAPGAASAPYRPVGPVGPVARGANAAAAVALRGQAGSGCAAVRHI